MISLKSVSTLLKAGQQQQFLRPTIRLSSGSHRKPSPCYTRLKPPDRRPCFDIRDVSLELGTACHARMIRSFLYTQHWPREPTVVGLWMDLDCSYLDVLTEKYSNSGYRLLAFERKARTNEKKLIGVCVANKVFPWAPDELEDWAHNTKSAAERNRMYFFAHCYRSPNLFKRYHTQYIYDVEVLSTAAEVTGQGVGTLLLKSLINHSVEMRYPVVQVIAVSQYTAKICERCGMNRVWSMDYSDFVDNKGQRVFFPRRPHRAAAVYAQFNDPKLPPPEPCKPPAF